MFIGTFCTFLSGFSRGDRGDELVPRTPRAPFHMSGLGGRLQIKMTLFPLVSRLEPRAHVMSDSFLGHGAPRKLCQLTI